jgi:uncharacterized protein YndB with AHSA1/START domain
MPVISSSPSGATYAALSAVLCHDVTMSDPVVATTSIAASPQRIWDLVSDVTRMGEWSPETTSCRWESPVRGAQVGSRFSGSNRRGWRRWATSCTVTAADPGRLFSFRVTSLGMRVAEWSYAMASITAVGDAKEGCELIETMVDERKFPMRIIGLLATGVADRSTHNHEGMVKTLAAIKRVAETPTS